MGQNSFSNAFDSTTNESTAGIPAQPVPLDSKQPSKRIQTKTIILIVIALLFGAGVTTAIFLLFVNRTVEEPNMADVIETNSPENDGTKTTEQMIDEYDETINSATDESDKLDLILDKADYYVLSDDYDSALATLREIDIDSLSSSKKQIVYNHFSTAYQGKGDDEQAAYYKQLANEAFNQAFKEQQGEVEEGNEEAQVKNEPTEDEGEE